MTAVRVVGERAREAECFDGGQGRVGGRVLYGAGVAITSKPRSRKDTIIARGRIR